MPCPRDAREPAILERVVDALLLGTEGTMAFIMKSPAFADGHQIPARYTRDGENVSPPLEWSGAPAGAQSYVLIIEDPDAPSGTFRHWAVYNIPGDRTGLQEGAGSGTQA